MGEKIHNDRIARCWQACWHRARRPVEGVLVSEEQATSIAEQAMRNVSLDYDELPDEPEFIARALEETARSTKQLVAEVRRRQADPQLHHDPDDKKYEANLDLDRLQKHDAGKGFQDREWNRLAPLLKPLALAVLSRKGIRSHDAEEVFNDSLAELVRERAESGHAPILDPTVFEEVIPLHSTIVGFRAIDWHRRRGTLRNQPNQGESLDFLDEPRLLGIETDPRETCFERIYAECRESLSSAEWNLIFTFYVAQSATVRELIENDEICGNFGLKKSDSASTRRRRLNEAIEEALGKIRKNLLS